MYTWCAWCTPTTLSQSGVEVRIQNALNSAVTTWRSSASVPTSADLAVMSARRTLMGCYWRPVGGPGDDTDCGAKRDTGAALPAMAPGEPAIVFTTARRSRASIPTAARLALMLLQISFRRVTMGWYRTPAENGGGDGSTLQCCDGDGIILRCYEGGGSRIQLCDDDGGSAVRCCCTQGHDADCDTKHSPLMDQSSHSLVLDLSSHSPPLDRSGDGSTLQCCDGDRIILRCCEGGGSMLRYCRSDSRMLQCCDDDGQRQRSSVQRQSRTRCGLRHQARLRRCTACEYWLWSSATTTSGQTL
jgi:hypothetical protein